MSGFISSQDTSSIQINPFSSVFGQTTPTNTIINTDTAALGSLGSYSNQPEAPFTGTDANWYDLSGAILGGIKGGLATPAGRPCCWW
jgi:hypothetical protein